MFTSLRRRTLLSSAAALSALALAPGGAGAASSDACVPLPTTKAFDQVDGDTADYSPAPGGGFEFGAPGWQLPGAARVVLGNETLGARPGLRSLRLPLGSSATSPEFCVDHTKPHFRFAYKVDNVALGGFMALVVYRDAAGEVTNVELTSSKRVSPTPSRWQASDNSPLATLLPLGGERRSATVQIKILSLLPTDVLGGVLTKLYGQSPMRDAMLRAQGAYNTLSAAAWSPLVNVGVTIDSVMVDPYRRG